MTENGSECTAGAHLPATNNAQRLGDLPLGSLQSRAAARLLLEQRRGSEKRADVVMAIEGLPPSQMHASEESRDQDGVVRRIVCLPAGMPLVEGLQSVGGYSKAQLERIAEEWPGLPPADDLLVIER